jgi:hypothetical protein
MPPIVISAGVSMASKRGAGELGPAALGRVVIGPDGLSLSFLFSRAVTITTGDGFSLDASVSGPGIGVIYDAGSGKLHQFVSLTQIAIGETVTLDYVSVPGDIVDSESNDLDSITDKPVINRPIPALAYVSPSGEPYLSPSYEYYLGRA